MRARVVLINGSFGVGKTAVAVALRSRLAGSTIYDPECTGPVLRLAARYLPLSGSTTDDFQDMPSWRRSAILGTRLMHATRTGIVLVPMAFDDIDYYREIVDGIRSFEPTVTTFCLTASLERIRERLKGRGTDPEEKWIRRRAEECVAAHVDDQFGERVDTEDRTVDEVAREILARLEQLAYAR
jgi:chloramphenicol 3-O-phosphotransferase